MAVRVVEPPGSEPWIERVIRKAQDEGKLDAVEGAGKPIPGLSRPYDPSWWARRWVETERARETAAELSRTVEQALPRILARESIDEIRSGLEELNNRIDAHNIADPGNQLAVLDIERLISARRNRRAR